MSKPELQTIELCAGLQGLTAWVNARYLGSADVVGDAVFITAMARQVDKGQVKAAEAENPPPPES